MNFSSLFCRSSLLLDGYSLRLRSVVTLKAVSPFNRSRLVSTQPADRETAWRKAVNVIKSFGKGAKLLIADVRQVWQFRNEMRGFKISGSTPMVMPEEGIKMEQIRLVYKTRADLKRTLPTLILFCIPLLGYAAPFLALLFPGQLLSSHFWSNEQKKDFLLKSLEKRRKALLTFPEVLSKEDSGVSVCIKKMINKEISYSEFKVVVDNDDIQQLSSDHLRVLSQVWGVSSAIIPLKWFQCRKLRQHLHYILSCDRALEREGVENVKEELLLELVMERLPLTTTSSVPELKATLREWLSTSLPSNDQVTNELFLAHIILMATGDIQ